MQNTLRAGPAPGIWRLAIGSSDRPACQDGVCCGVPVQTPRKKVQGCCKPYNVHKAVYKAFSSPQAAKHRRATVQCKAAGKAECDQDFIDAINSVRKNIHNLWHW
jgi:hypothetical protein